ncbi:MAG: PIN domain-containing protein [Actinobacteria bacterium]|nr:PIN domain-containing protein [Actinomycetota bacterium]
MILLDTNVISELMRHTPDRSVVQWVDAQPGYRLYIQAVTRAEIELGIELLPKGRRRQALQTAATRMFGEFHGRRFLIFKLRKEAGRPSERVYSPAHPAGCACDVGPTDIFLCCFAYLWSN